MGNKALQPCGTQAAYRRHLSKGEQPCDACRAAAAAYQRDRLRAIRSGEREVRQLQPCGTRAAYRRHLKRNETPCEDCVEAARLDNRRREEQRALAGSRTPFDPSKCGSQAGYRQHIRKRIAPCDECREASRQYSNDYNRRRGIPPRTAAVCGTRGGYAAHRRKGETPCDACREAHTAYRRSRGVPPAKQAQCGTRSGYWRHRRMGERACEPCLRALREAQKPRRHWRELWMSQDGVCALCDQDLPRESEMVVVDHIVPRSRGGSDDKGNAQVVHGLCNGIKGNSDNDVARQIILQKVESGEWVLMSRRRTDRSTILAA